MGVTPVFLAMTTDLSPKQQRRTAFKAVLTAFVVLTLFAVAGRLLFQFFGISVNGFRIAGGVIFFIMGYDMLNARLSRLKYDDQDIEKELDDIAITPLGIPMIAGPSVLAMLILMTKNEPDELTSWFFALIIAWAITSVILLASPFLLKILRIIPCSFV